MGHEVLVLGGRGVVHSGPDGDPVRGVEHHPDNARTVLGHAAVSSMIIICTVTWMRLIVSFILLESS